MTGSARLAKTPIVRHAERKRKVLLLRKDWRHGSGAVLYETKPNGEPLKRPIDNFYPANPKVSFGGGGMVSA
jgi:hypothetical protein